MNRRRAPPSPLFDDVAFGLRHGAFDDPLGKSLLRTWWSGASDEQLEGMIRHRVHRLKVQDVFGVLDPFPKPRMSSGDVMLGLDCDGREVRIPVQWLNAGLLIAANTGSGKSNLLAAIAAQVAATGCRVWLSDTYKTQTRHWRALFRQAGTDLIVLRASDWKFNLLQPNNIHPRAHLAMAVDVLVRRLELPTRARAILHQACYDLYRKFSIWEGRTDAYPCLFDLYEWVRSATNLNAAAREAMLDRLGALLAALTPQCAAYRIAWKPSELGHYSIDFEMRGTTETVKQVLLESTLYSIMQHEVERGLVNAPMNLFLAFEDAQRFFDAQQKGSGELTPIDELAGVIRGTGKGLGVIVQTMQGMSRRLVPNLATKIMGRLGSHDDYARLGADLGMNAKQIEWARRRLKPGTFIVQVAEGNWREPSVVSVSLLKIPSSVSDDEAASSVRILDQLRTVPAREFDAWRPDHRVRVAGSVGDDSVRDFHSTRDPADGSSQEARESKNGGRTREITKDLLDYLAAVAADPLQSCTDRDRRLGISGSKGHRIRAALVRHGFATLVPVNPGGRGKRFQLLELTSDGRDLLKAYRIPCPQGHGRGGIEHQWWCQTIADWLRGLGVRAEIEDESRGVRVDLVGTRADGDVLAVEVEISTGHEITNVSKALEAGFRTVVSLVKQKAAVRRVRFEVEALRNGLSGKKIHVGVLWEYAEVLESVVSGGS